MLIFKYKCVTIKYQFTATKTLTTNFLMTLSTSPIALNWYLVLLWTLLYSTYHTIVFEASMPQALRIPTMLIVLFDAIRRIFLFHGHSTLTTENRKKRKKNKMCYHFQTHCMFLDCVTPVVANLFYVLIAFCFVITITSTLSCVMNILPPPNGFLQWLKRNTILEMCNKLLLILDIFFEYRNKRQ
uniref:TMEM127 domain-containing protein n=1 Tax=Heterorhabditis bacteriophora TaxID=37862 RepID=A0A1I7WKE3_HETBA